MKYIFFDIDNTLVSHVNTPHIPPETRQAVELLKVSGHIPAIATGRAGFLTMTTAREFGIEYLVCSGGSQIFVRGQEIHTAFFPDEHLNAFREVAHKFPEVTAAVDEKYLYTCGAFDDFRTYFNEQAGYDCVRPLEQMTHAIMCYIMLPPKTLTPEHGIFFSPPEGVRLELMNNFTEARHENSTKWRGIEMLIQHEGADIRDVITFGDGPNDADMLKNAAVGVAVGRCSQTARDSADFVCDDIDNGGILKACYSLGLIGQ